MTPVVRVCNVSKVFPMEDAVVHALRGVSFEIAPAEFVSILGPSGSGKSTCMHMIGCLDRPSSGSVFIAGENTACMSERALAHLRNRTVGFVFQQYFLLPTLTVLENVMLPLRYQGVEYFARRRRAEDELAKVGLSDRLAHRPSELSGGQKQRVAIARALVTRPKIIVADEPTGALDSETGRSVLDLFIEINKKGTAVIIVTHDQGVGALASRSLTLKDGKIVGDHVRGYGGADGG
ncbi:ABC transporter ATP-binding protein [Treponema pallidum]|uniref:ABC transporter ATP-binding protein n=1 Tax=Treponema pallidum TaxID=160 RepID=UPI00244EA5A1|nr:ABC transporter ATP-binding protein [Treponema pallidum]WGK72405.1 putative macrolide ABC superfamily ATP binding cassette transporter, ABC protein [Treponema pallidum subsp. pertenue]WGK76298.1 putative macrolide ABC superfamily ATP binding cassette transporter, ABC protein [Treponema pallidum subsp. pertenue]